MVQGSAWLVLGLSLGHPMTGRPDEKNCPIASTTERRRQKRAVLIETIESMREQHPHLGDNAFQGKRDEAAVMTAL